MNKFPKYFAIKFDNSTLWDEYVNWLNNNYKTGTWLMDTKWVNKFHPNKKNYFLGTSKTKDNDGTFWDPSIPTYCDVITLQQWYKIVNNVEYETYNTIITMKKLVKVLEGLHSNKELRRTCIPLFLGNPGLGKTKIIEQFAESKDVKLVEIIASQLMPHEISGIAIPDQKSKLMSYFDFDKLLTLKDGDIILFDELLNANPMVLNALLTLLENRKMISGKPLADVMFVAAANPQGATMMTPQIKERFIFYDVTFDRKMWAQYMYAKYDIIDPILDELMVLIENESFANSGRNYLTPRSIDKAISMMIYGIDTPYAKELGPLLNKLIENTTKDTIKVGSYEFSPGEKISWLKLKQKQLKNDKITTE